MPTDTSTQSVEIAASAADVLATLRDVAGQPDWIPEILEAEVLTTFDSGLPATARFKAKATVGTDRYTLSYDHDDDGMSWTMLSGVLQTGQEGLYTVTPLAPGRVRVTYELTIHHNLPLPGFVRSRVIRGLVASTLGGLKSHLEGAAA